VRTRLVGPLTGESFGQPRAKPAVAAIELMQSNEHPE
jgi:hypothetical protein